MQVRSSRCFAVLLYFLPLNDPAHNLFFRTKERRIYRDWKATPKNHRLCSYYSYANTSKMNNSKAASPMTTSPRTPRQERMTLVGLLADLPLETIPTSPLSQRHRCRDIASILEAALEIADPGWNPDRHTPAFDTSIGKGKTGNENKDGHEHPRQ
mmetsp:Transcript_28605/g.50688  ORF Transcript_28605/g.50688 Transcript_28605/m.50688 type:complete len:155 (+) Transcript_28605:113-577(+)